MSSIPSLPAVPPGLFTRPTLTVRPWHDELIDTLGFDPRSAYVECYWLGILGPSTVWFMRRLAAAFDNSPEIHLDLAAMATELGLGHKGGRHSPFMRTVWRCVQFDMARVVDEDFEVRRKLPPLNRRQVQRLPDHLRESHEQWQAAQLRIPPGESSRRRARALAMSLLELDADAAAVEQRMTACGVPAGLAQEAAAWAWNRHAQARAAAS